MHVCTGSSEKDTNNGYQAIVLTEYDILTICENLKSASKDWFNLGLAFKVKFSYLKNIQDQYLENNRRLAEVVGKRLEVTDPKHPMTWPYICECLRSPTVERNDVAEEIEDKYLRAATAVDLSRPPTITGEATEHTEQGETVTGA